MGSRGSASGAGKVKLPTSYRGPGDYGEAFSRLNPKLSPEVAADRAVREWQKKEMPLVDDDDMNAVYETAYMDAAKRRGYSNLKINNALNDAFGTTDVLYTGKL